MLGEQAAESIIRSALDRRRSEPHFQRSIVLAFNRVAAATRLHPDTKRDNISILGHIHIVNLWPPVENRHAGRKI